MCGEREDGGNVAHPEPLTLFDRHELVRCPLCTYVLHCGNKAELGPPERVSPTTVNRSIRCLSCQRTGEQSVRT